MSAAFNNIGVVVIGRNEGKRLHSCLASIVGQAEAVLYVDSGSTDNSVSIALAMGDLIWSVKDVLKLRGLSALRLNWHHTVLRWRLLFQTRFATRPTQ